MQTSWSRPRPSLAERFWSLAEAAERRPETSSRPVGVVRHILDILGELEAGLAGEAVAPTTRAFLAELANRELHGDYAYLAPERAPGDTPHDTALVYSVGVLLLEGLTGRNPFGSVEASRRQGGLHGETLAMLIVQAPEIPAALRGVLGRATSADPAHRFPSVAALAAELEWFMVTEQESVIPLPAPALRSAPVVPMPAVVVDPRALVPSRPPSMEMQLETALVPKLSMEDLAPRRRRPEKKRRPVLVEPARPRRSEPSRRARRDALRMAVIALSLMCGSAAVTALVMFLLQR